MNRPLASDHTRNLDRRLRQARPGERSSVALPDTTAESLRILAVADLWQGSDSYAWVRSLRRRGHSVRTVPSENYVPGKWTSTPLRTLRRLLEPVLVREYERVLLKEAERLRPHLFFVHKGHYVTRRVVEGIRELGTIAVNVYPDVSVLAHGRHIPAALPAYDWVYTTKSFGIDDMRRELGVHRSSLLQHGFDPEVHRPVTLDQRDQERYGCEVSFIGTWSPRKQSQLETLVRAEPDLNLRVWGDQWGRARSTLRARVMGRPVLGVEYAKAINASRINLALLSESRQGSSMGDQITARTFHITGSGGFMLHVRTAELAEHFVDGQECAMFGDDDEMVDRVRWYLDHDDERAQIAEGGRQRAERSGYSIDARAATLLESVRTMTALS